MKTRKIIATLLAISVLFGIAQTTFASVVHADEVDTQTELPSYIGDSYLANYFYRLSDFGYNSVGTCMYIALSMILTYYDCYWDDNLVADSYFSSNSLSNHAMHEKYDDCTSPGPIERINPYLNALYEQHYLLDKASAWSQYLGQSNKYIDNSLQAYLINLFQTEIRTTDTGGLSEDDGVNLLNKYLEVRDNENSAFSDAYWNVEEQNYLDYVKTILGEDYTPEEYAQAVIEGRLIDVANYSNNLMQTVKNSIQAGQPVLLSIYSPSTTTEEAMRHAAVGYAYDEETDTIYVHCGWENASCIAFDKIADFPDLTGNTREEYLIGFIVLEPVGEHVHSNNYIFSDYSNGVCSCQFPNHEHQSVLTSFGASGHADVCYCGSQSQVVNHQLSYVSMGEYGHSASCSCGYSHSESHMYKAQGIREKACIYCGHTVLISPDTPVVSPLYIQPIDETHVEAKKE